MNKNEVKISELGLLSSPLGQIEAIYQLPAVHWNIHKDNPVHYQCNSKVQMRKNQLSLISHILTDRMQVPENQLQQLRPYQARVQKSLEKIDVPGRVETLQKNRDPFVMII